MVFSLVFGLFSLILSFVLKWVSDTPMWLKLVIWGISSLLIFIGVIGMISDFKALKHFNSGRRSSRFIDEVQA